MKQSIFVKGKEMVKMIIGVVYLVYCLMVTDKLQKGRTKRTFHLYTILEGVINTHALLLLLHSNTLASIYLLEV